jgi:hypothetical protein
MFQREQEFIEKEKKKNDNFNRFNYSFVEESPKLESDKKIVEIDANDFN